MTPGASGTELGDISPDSFRRLLHEVADWIADYRENINDRPISPTAQPGAIIQALPRFAPEIGEPVEEIWRDVQELIVPGMVHWGHPQFMGYFGSTSTGPGVLAEMICAALNVNAMTWRTSPAATELETVVLEWLREWLGLPPSFAGVVYDTASISTMHALAAAREEAAGTVRKAGLAGRQLPLFRIYTSDQAHSSVEKAAIALGLGEENVRRVASDAQFRLATEALRLMIRHDVEKGFRPLAVVATVGTTSTASVDPVLEIAALCRSHDMWLHIDAAYGGGLALLPEASWVKDGWNEADSLVINPHKMLFVPFDFSALFVKDIARLRDVFSLVPEYLRGDSVGADINYMDYGVQLGRRFRALKAWMVWRAFGREGMAARIREHMRLARLFASWLETDSRFELLAPVTMGVVCFGIKNDLLSSEETTRSLVEQLNSTGKTYLTRTKLHGRDAIRLGLGNILTNEGHLRTVWQMILGYVSRAAN
ncbi:MAG: amino acid decarboxylase [Chthoniobacterales bacterium]|nr:amino acid decarboxylase [Chthoniobacterales bacterium]